jgi:ABC-2 type transport system ATP-binding protein
VSRAISFAFAGKQKALLEMSLKKANLEDIFIELTKEDEQP